VQESVHPMICLLL